MIEYKIDSEHFCIIIWDGDKTTLPKVLGDLTPKDPNTVTVGITIFDQGNDNDKATKILEEASEIRGALQYEGRDSKQVLYEICDTITACLNLATSLGYSQTDIQDELDIVEVNNIKRGRYVD